MNLEARIRELIAVGASVAAHCQPCLEHHVSKAMGLGVNAEEISEAIKVGRMVGRGATSSMDRFASRFHPAGPLDACGARQTCGCDS
jgi:AhpD family alkylhydroperoxidase